MNFLLKIVTKKVVTKLAIIGIDFLMQILVISKHSLVNEYDKKDVQKITKKGE